MDEAESKREASWAHLVGTNRDNSSAQKSTWKGSAVLLLWAMSSGSKELPFLGEGAGDKRSLWAGPKCVCEYLLVLYTTKETYDRYSVLRYVTILGFSRERELIGYIDIDLLWELVLKVMKAEKFYDLPSVSWRTRKSSSIIQSQTKVMRTRAAGGISLSLNPKA